MMGDTDYNSCCYYMYACLDTDQLLINSQGSPDVIAATPQLLSSLIESIAYTNPSGKQNSFAGHSFPGLICIECKEKKVPISYANAFENPVRSKGGYMTPSIEALVKAIDQFDECYALPILERIWFCPAVDISPNNATNIQTLPELLKKASKWM